MVEPHIAPKIRYHTILIRPSSKESTVRTSFTILVMAFSIATDIGNVNHLSKIEN